MALLICGCNAWDVTGKTVKKDEPIHGEMVMLPSRLAPSLGLKFSAAYTGPQACHTVCITEEGKCYSFGRNDKGQLGHGDGMTRGAPTIIKALENVRIVKVALGKNHTIFLTSGGEVWSCGGNQFGQLGIGKTCDKEEKPKQLGSLGSKVVDVSAGIEFSMLVTEDGKVYSCGHPEYGSLGHGTDGRYIISTGREGFREESSPTLITMWHMSDVKGKDYLGPLAQTPIIKRVYCGNKHTLAADSEGGVWSWGYNGYGRLGLNDPHDRKRPCKIEFFSGPNAIKNLDMIVTGGATSGAVSGLGQLYTWGQVKKVGESQWGGGKYGELGLSGGKKSSANPAVVDSLTGKEIKMVAAGMGHTCFILADGVDAEQFPAYEPPADVAPAPAAAGKGGKRGAPPAKGGAAKKKAKK